MKRITSCGFVASLLLFLFAAASPTSKIAAQMPYWCPGGSTLLCGTSTQKTCVAVDDRTAQCKVWKEETLYYYYGPNGDDGTGECQRICQT